MAQCGTTDLKSHIGETAGKLWKTLARNGETDLPTLTRTLKCEPEEVHLAVGWLARENKVELKKNGRSFTAALTPTEKEQWGSSHKTSQGSCSSV